MRKLNRIWRHNNGIMANNDRPPACSGGEFVDQKHVYY